VAEVIFSSEKNAWILMLKIQAKFTVGAANDAYEQEADRVVAQVISVPVKSIVGT
jgi:hypothetical protein